MRSKKSSKKKRLIWHCNECKDFDKMKQPCPHLEKILDPVKKEPTYEGTHRRVGGNMDLLIFQENNSTLVIPEKFKNGYYEARFRNRVMKMGVPRLIADIMTLRFVYGATIRDIGEELGIVSPGQVFKMLKDGMAIFKKGISK